nr:PREDICTED: E1A-binding protein p400-like [Linepithema humile]XP_012225745.1 PREDICTED: E1A-binding protein p400-like [Linepithema humile]XP_012225746.1 PREDICTED: E1A-binding protein p400-like [Linepithema humile]
MRHKEESVFAPRSLFDRPSSALMKMRRDMKMHNKYRTIARALVPVLKTSSHVTKTSPEPDHAVDWLVYEEWGLLHPIQSYQNLPLNTMILTPGHTPNWDMVADTINNSARLHRSPKHCRGRYGTVIMPREEGKLMYDVAPKKQKKQKGSVYKTPQVSESKTNRALRTSQLHNQDKNNSFTMMGNQKYETVKSVSNKRTPIANVKLLLVNSLMRNPGSAAVLLESGIQVESPMVPMDVATKRANRIAKERVDWRCLFVHVFFLPDIFILIFWY